MGCGPSKMQVTDVIDKEPTKSNSTQNKSVEQNPAGELPSQKRANQAKRSDIVWDDAFGEYLQIKGRRHLQSAQSFFYRPDHQPAQTKQSNLHRGGSGVGGFDPDNASAQLNQVNLTLGHKK